jgi:signal transduction histidine kinase
MSLIEVAETGPASGSAILTETAIAVAHGSSLEALSRPFLKILHDLTELDSVYLTEVDLSTSAQTILYSANQGEVTVPEGLTVPWEDSLCFRALERDLRYTSDVGLDLPGSSAGNELGLRTYVSVPVVGSDNELMGTLCGASGAAVPVSAEVVDIMAMLGRLIADQWKRDRRAAEDQRRAEAAEAAIRDRDRFLAVAEHQLKTPLMVLQGWSAVLADEWEVVPGETRQVALLDMRDAAAAAIEQLDQLLARARSGVLSDELDLVPVQVGPLVERTARQIEAAASGNHKIVTATTPAVVLGDSRALWQVLWHLGENAVKFSPDGGLVSIEVEVVEERVLVHVSDEGVGIATDIDVFAPFTRSDADRFEDIKGTGLGLHIVHTLVAAMGGTVTATRRPTRGSVMTVTLPAVG